MSKRIVLVDALGYELFSGTSVARGDQEPPKKEADVEKVERVERVEKIDDARQGGPLESGIFFRGSPRLRKTG